MTNIFHSTTIPALEQTVRFSQARHEVLVGNIANLDTPGYRVRDMSVETFQQRLGQSLEAQRQRPEPVSPGVLLAEPDRDMQQVHPSLPSILFHDDSDVGMEQQVAQISKNEFLHNMAISIMTSQFRLLQAAISEQA